LGITEDIADRIGEFVLVAHILGLLTSNTTLSSNDDVKAGLDDLYWQPTAKL
jgi:hypothetical protein